MASVFLSYDREDSPRARGIAAALENAGHSVWWDQHIKGGAQYSKEIEQALKKADAVVVLWSERSVESAWVRDEAAAGRDTGRLVPVSLDGCEPPLGFRQYQTVKLPGGRLGRSGKHELLDAVRTITGAPKAETVDRPRIALGAPPRLALIGIVGLLLAAGAGLFLWSPLDGRTETVFAIAPGGDDAGSRTFARDLAIKLSAQQTASAFPFRLVEFGDGSTEPDLVFEATASGSASADLVLKSAKNSTILWSKEFEQPSGNRADLVQQVTYTAGRIVGCVMEGLAGRVKLDPAPLKTYLNACAQMSELGSFDLRPPLALLHEVTEASPKFEPAWAELLLSEADLATPESAAAEPDPKLIADLRRHIAEAKAINPAMPAAEIAETSLLPPRDFLGRMKRLEKALASSPGNPKILNRMAGALSETGRLREAVRLAGKAVLLDPLSPILHGSYTSLIAYSGNFDSARRELAKAEKLWPGTMSLEDTQYRFHYRYGDPRVARGLFEKYSDSGGRAIRMFLDARESPGPSTIEPLIAHVRERLANLENPSAGIGFATVAFATFDRQEDVFSTLLNWPKPDDLAIISEVFFRPEFRNTRRDPRFLRIAQRAGLLDYWRTSGKWPDFCFEPDQPYDCKAEAAKLTG